MKSLFMGLLGVALLFAFGCGTSDDKPAGGKAVASAKGEDTKHSGWWCDEHGVPEAKCSMCSPKVAAECKAKGDWCDKHDRAKSQCFFCDPKLKEKFAAEYRAKEGKEPPEPTEN